MSLSVWLSLSLPVLLCFFIFSFWKHRFLKWNKKFRQCDALWIEIYALIVIVHSPQGYESKSIKNRLWRWDFVAMGFWLAYLGLLAFSCQNTSRDSGFCIVTFDFLLYFDSVCNYIEQIYFSSNVSLSHGLLRSHLYYISLSSFCQLYFYYVCRNHLIDYKQSSEIKFCTLYSIDFIC